MENKQPLLTIAIPTYNRPEQIQRQVRSLLPQLHSQIVLVVCDNCSPISVQSLFNEEELSYFKIERNSVNIGGNPNIARCFEICETKWLWILSDDDSVSNNAIERIFHDIELYGYVSMFKYSIEDFEPEEDCELDTITEFLDYYKSGIHTSGSMIFVSNNIFNIEHLKPYIGKAVTWSHTCVPHLIPLLLALIDRRGIIKFRKETIVKYLPPDPSTAWNFIEVILGISTISSINIDLNKCQHIELKRILVRSFSHVTFIRDCLLMKNKYKQINIYNKVYFSLYIYDRNYHWIYFISFYLCLFAKRCFNMDVFYLLIIIKKKTCKS
jgi:glycosyltransferase involved in cell wall biosynthesis